MAGELTVVPAEQKLVALITCPDQNSAEQLAEALVASQAAACVNIVPGITSLYRWQGEVCRDQEHLLVVKTTEQARERVAAAVTKHHRYDEPELIFLPLHSGSESYLAWVSAQVEEA